jgi:hypothetical protein
MLLGHSRRTVAYAARLAVEAIVEIFASRCGALALD